MDDKHTYLVHNALCIVALRVNSASFLLLGGSIGIGRYILLDPR